MTRHPGDNQIANADTPIIYNVTMTTKDFEYSQALPTNCRKFQIRPRSLTATIKLAYVSGESGTNYETVRSGGLWHDLVGISGKTLYFQSATAGLVAEIEAWS